MATQTLTATEVATELGTNPRTFRRFLRAEVRSAGGEVGKDTPGKGKRYSFTAKEVSGLRERFQAWDEARSAKPEPEAEEASETEEG
jgi:predicted transcriptional regulator